MAVLPKAICAAAASVANLGRCVARGKCLGSPAFIGLIALTARAPDAPSYRRLPGERRNLNAKNYEEADGEWRSRVARIGFTPCRHDAVKNRKKSAGKSACAAKAA